MSKRAEELWATLTQRYWERQDMSRDEGLALIDDFARKVLERAAERFRKKYFSLVATEEYEDDEIADMWNLYITEHCCSAILSPEED